MSVPISTESSASAARGTGRSPAANGILAILFANALWGAFPLLFNLLKGVPAELIVAHRIVWALLILTGMLWVGGRMGEIRALFGNRGLLLRLLASSLVLALNWLIYVVAVEADRVLEASFGYFFTPLVNVAMGMVLLNERMTPLQWAAMAVATIAIGIQAAGLGEIPWLALALAFSFGIYGYLRKTVPVSSTGGLFAETAVLFPLAAGYIAYWVATNGAGPHADPWQLFLLALTGLASVASLVAFAYGAQRLPLTVLGMFQYIAPSLQFLLAVSVLGEPINPTRLFSFGLIWVSILIFTWDSLRRRGMRA